MIFGRTNAEREADRQELLRIQITCGEQKKAWPLPVKLENGQWAWRETYYEYLDGGIMPDGSYVLWFGSSETFLPIRRRYLERDNKHIRLTKMGEGKKELFNADDPYS